MLHSQKELMPGELHIVSFFSFLASLFSILKEEDENGKEENSFDGWKNRLFKTF